MTKNPSTPPPQIWGEKPYRSLDYHLRKNFGEKIYKLSLNAGMTCPNRDGTLGSSGCIFCSEGGSGDFAADAALSVTEQIEIQKKSMMNKKSARKFIAYFQAYTNTYAPISYLEKVFIEAIHHPDIAALSIGTRPDCLPEEVLSLLSRLNQIKPVWIELGLQTIRDDTARRIRRGYPLSCFEEAAGKLRGLGIDIIVHLILGLPGETNEDVLDAISYLNRSGIQGIKLHLLHVLKGTALAKLYEQNEFSCMTMEEYIDLILSCIGYLDPAVTIHRLTGDGPKDLLIAPLWSSKKRTVLNTIHSELKRNHIWQGCRLTDSDPSVQSRLKMPIDPGKTGGVTNV